MGGKLYLPPCLVATGRPQFFNRFCSIVGALREANDRPITQPADFKSDLTAHAEVRALRDAPSKLEPGRNSHKTLDENIRAQCFVTGACLIIYVEIFYTSVAQANQSVHNRLNYKSSFWRYEYCL